MSYTSSVTFFVTDLPFEDVTLKINGQDAKDVKRHQVLQLFFSSDIIEKVIEEFELYNGFDEDPNRKLTFIERFKDRVNVLNLKNGTFKLEVNHPDKYLAPQIAQTLMNEVELKSKKMVEEDFINKMELMDDYIRTTRENTMINSPEFQSGLLLMNKISSNIDQGNLNPEDAKELNAKISRLTSLMEKNMEGLTMSRDYFNVALSSLKNEKLKTFFIISPPIVDMSNKYLEIFFLAFGISLILTATVCLLGNMVYRQMNELKTFGTFPIEVELKKERITA